MRPDQPCCLLNSFHLERSVVCRFQGYPRGVSVLPIAVSDIKQVLHAARVLFLGLCSVSSESLPDACWWMDEGMGADVNTVRAYRSKYLNFPFNGQPRASRS